MSTLDERLVALTLAVKSKFAALQTQISGTSNIGLATAVASLSLASVAGNLFHTEGYRSTADGGETWYRRMAVIEANEDGMLTSADGVRLALLPKGPVSPENFAAYGDDSHDDSGAFAAMERWRIAHRKGGTEYGYSFGSVGVHLNPSRAYYLGTGTSSGVVGQNAGWNVYTTVFIQTPNGSGPSGLSSIIRVDDGTSGVIFHSGVSAGNTGFTTDRGYSATGSLARGLAVSGAFVATEGEYHGIHFRAKVSLVDPYATGFSGDGIHSDTFSFDGIHDDNVNGSSITNAWVYGCRDGIRINYNDANGVQINNPQVFSNRRYGIYYSGVVFLLINGGNSATNGCIPGFPTQAFNNGHVFGCLLGQETWCATNSPPATATNNQGWYWIYDTAAATASVPQWSSGARTYRNGASIRIDGGSATGGIHAHEVEGDQMPILCSNDPKVLITGGAPFGIAAITETGAAYGGCLAADRAGVYMGTNVPTTDNLYASGITTKRWTVVFGYTGDFTTQVIVGGNKILGARATGWTAATGTPARGAFAAAAAGTASAAYVQAELQGALNRIAALEARLIAYDADFRTHGLIGT